MRRSLLIALCLVASACLRSKPDVAPEPAEQPQPAPATGSLAACKQDKVPVIMYIVDGKKASCSSVMSIPSKSIVSVEVVKGPTAVSRFGVAPGSGVVVIQTKRDR